MNSKLPSWTLSFGLVLLLAPFSLSAQQGTLSGTVTGRLTGQPVALADIQIQGGGETRTVRTNAVDSYAIFDLNAGYECPTRPRRYSFR